MSWRRMAVYLEMIKVQHTVFALPFALTAALVCAHGMPSGEKLFWIIVAMIGARSAAMGFNRIVDREIDARNPRTKDRAIPAGKISVAQAWVWVWVFTGVFLGACAMLNGVCLLLAFPTLLVLFGYSYTKRFTHFSHMFLGLALGLSPVGAWVAISGVLAWQPAVLGLAVLCWVAGFDIIYATMDREFDAANRIHSLVRTLGVDGALRIARRLHFGFVLLLCAFGAVCHLGLHYFLGVAAIALLLWTEHTVVSPADLRKVNLAFFTINGVISIALLIATGFDLL